MSQVQYKVVVPLQSAQTFQTLRILAKPPKGEGGGLFVESKSCFYSAIEHWVLGGWVLWRKIIITIRTK